jgi:hypothetical protein
MRQDELHAGCLAHGNGGMHRAMSCLPYPSQGVHRDEHARHAGMAAAQARATGVHIQWPPGAMAPLATQTPDSPFPQRPGSSRNSRAVTVLASYSATAPMSLPDSEDRRAAFVRCKARRLAPGRGKKIHRNRLPRLSFRWKALCLSTGLPATLLVHSERQAASANAPINRS